jgi:AcrR family transcriptional regulator
MNEEIIEHVPPDETQRRMLDAAMLHIRSHGLCVGFDDLRLDDVIEAAGVSRSSAFRRWGSRTAFIEDLLVEVAMFGAGNLSDADAMNTAVAVVSGHLEWLHTSAGREKLMAEVIRTTLENNYFSTLDSVAWQSYLSISATLLTSMPREKRGRLESALKAGNAKFIGEMAMFYEHISTLIGFRLRNEFNGGFDLFATLASSVVEGLAVRHQSNPQLTDELYSRETPYGSEQREWSAAAIGFWAIFRTFVELDPDFDGRPR